MIIRSMYFRDEEEIQYVKELLAERRGKQVVNHKQKNKLSLTIEDLRGMLEDLTPMPKTPTPKPAQANIKLPGFLIDVMNGMAFPAPEELTKSEQAILYDQTINGLVNQYRQTKKFDLAVQIRERLDEIGVDF